MTLLKTIIGIMITFIIAILSLNVMNMGGESNFITNVGENSRDYNIPNKCISCNLSDNSSEIRLIVEFKDEGMLEYEKNIDNQSQSITEIAYGVTHTKAQSKDNKLKNHKKALDDERTKFIKDMKIKKVHNNMTQTANRMSITIDRKDLKSIENNSNVKKIWEDKKVTIDAAIIETGSSLVGVQQRLGVTDVWLKKDSNNKYINGTGVKIAIIDTGIDYTHEAFGECPCNNVPTCNCNVCTNTSFLAGTCNKVIYGWDFVNNDADPMDDNAHGTHCAGIAAGNKMRYYWYRNMGMAPEAKLVAYKVLDAGGSGYDSNIILAIENATNYGVDVMSMSFGSQGDYIEDSPYTAVFQAAINKNITLVIAAGNSGSGLNTIGSPGIEPLAITVGAIYYPDWNTPQITSYSSRGPVYYKNHSLYEIKPDILAPGEVSSSIPGNGSAFYRGTSMATPVIAGLAALMKQQYPTSTSDMIKKRLTNSADKLNYNSYEQGFGLANVLKASNLDSRIDNPNNVFEVSHYSPTTYTINKTFILTNTGSKTLTYTIGSTSSTSNIQFSTNSSGISIASGKNATVKITLSYYSFNLSEGIYSGYILINTSNNTQLSLPLIIKVEYVTGLTWLHQESPVIPRQTFDDGEGLLYSGNYSFAGAWVNPEYIIDGYWFTTGYVEAYSNATQNIGTYTFTYMKPEGATPMSKLHINWIGDTGYVFWPGTIFEWDTSSYNDYYMNIPESCWSYSPTNITFTFFGTIPGNGDPDCESLGGFWCYNGVSGQSPSWFPYDKYITMEYHINCLAGTWDWWGLYEESMEWAIIGNPVTYNDSYCYQETANVSTSCGGLNTGKYWIRDTNKFEYVYSNLYDGNWSTGAYFYGVPAEFRINYTKPINVISAILQAEWGYQLNPVAIQNFTIPNSCLINDVLQIRIIGDYTKEDGDTISCIDYTNNWVYMDETNHGGFFEEGVYWNIRNASMATLTIWNGTQWDSTLNSYLDLICYNNQSGCAPSGQTDLQSIYKITNTGKQTGTKTYMKLVPTCSGVDIKCGTSNIYANSIKLNSTNVLIYSGNVNINSSIYVWCWADFNNPENCDFDIYTEIN